MTRWRFDEAVFIDEVLKPVQNGWQSKDDLFRVYLLPPDVTDDKAITAALDEIKRQFNPQRYRSFRRACESLRLQHAAAEAVLRDSDRRRQHRDQVAERARKLTESMRQRLNGAPGLPAADVAALVAGAHGTLTRTAVRAALTGAGGAELDPVELPATPEPAHWAETRGLLALLEFDSLWDYLSGVLGGPAPTVDKLDERRAKLRVSRNVNSTSETSLLKKLQQWIEVGDLVSVLRHETLGELAARSNFGYADVLAGARDVAGRLRQLALPAEPAAVAYAVWCTQRVGGERAPAWQDDYRQAVNDMRLRAAHAVLGAQPKLPPEWFETREKLAAQLSAVDIELNRLRVLERSDTEAAVEGYRRLREQLADETIDTAIERCRPARPRSATAEVHAGQVAITWPPSTSTVGRITYRVSRGDTVLRDDGLDCAAVDHQPPGGTPLVYSIHTLRDGNPSADAARTQTVTVLPDVSALVLVGDPDAVSGRWQLPSGAIGAIVVRGGTQLPDAGPTTFVDRDVRPGVHYGYLVHARYRLPDGSTGLSPGVSGTAACQELPVAVADLSAEFEDGEVFVRFTPPSAGVFHVLELPAGAQPPEPDVLPATQAMRCGTPVQSSAPSGRGQLRGRLMSRDSRVVLVPVTVFGELAAIGPACVVDVRQSPVRGLRLQRLGSTIRLSWQWPAGAGMARVLWRHGARPSGPTDPEADFLDVTKVTHDSRGVSVEVAQGECWFAVCTLVDDERGRTFGPLAVQRESVSGTARYTVKRLRRRGPWVLTIRTEHDLELPPVVLRAKTGARPMGSDDGQQLGRTEAGPSPVRVEFDVPSDMRRPVYLRAYSLDENVVLLPSQPTQLVVG